MRRPRYKGRHPIKPEHRYKELQPEKYSIDLDQIRAKGRTPLGTHIPIMVPEVLERLCPRPGEVGVDLTLGYGGHSQKFLEFALLDLAPESTFRLIGFDRDPIELKKTRERMAGLGFEAPRFLTVQANFSELSTELHRLKVKGVDFLFADLGLSSMQIDDPERGFTLKTAAPLDLRMNVKEGLPASDFLKQIPVVELEKILREFGDEPYPHKLAEAIGKKARLNKLRTTWDLRDCILETLKKIPRYPAKPELAVKRAFQAIRIEINGELVALQELLGQIPAILNPGARVAFLTFHSGEDRLVKKFFAEGQKKGVFSEVGGPTQATADEVFRNRRARPAKLRWGRKA